MFRHTISMLFVVLMIGGCASSGTMDSSPGSSSTAGEPPASSNPATVGVAGAESSSTAPMMSSTATAESPEAKQSRQTRIAAGVEEETLDTCIARIPQNRSEEHTSELQSRRDLVC